MRLTILTCLIFPAKPTQSGAIMTHTQIRLISTLMVGLVFTGFMSACGKVKTEEELIREELVSEISKYQVAEGIYGGYLYRTDAQDSKKNPINDEADLLLGTLVLELNARTVFTSDHSSRQKAVLSGQITFHSEETTLIEFTESHFDPDRGSFQTAIPLILDSGESETLDISGTITHGVFTGEVSLKGYADARKRFHLKKDSQFLEKVTEELRVARAQPKERQLVEVFQGDLKFSFGERQSAELILIQEQLLSSESLMRALRPVRKVHMTLNFGNGADVLFQNALWDRRTETLRGSALTTLEGKSIRVFLDCDSRENTDQLKCSYLNNQSGSLAVGVFSRSGKEKKMESQALWRTLNLKGSAEFHINGTQKPVSLRLLYRNISTASELYRLPLRRAQATFNFGDGIKILFENSEWNLEEKTLSGETLIQRGSEMGHFHYLCEINSTWACEFHNHLLGPIADIHLSPVTLEAPLETKSPQGQRVATRYIASNENSRLGASELILIKRDSHSEDLLFNDPFRPVELTYRLGDSIQVHFPEAEWDLHAGRVWAKTTLTLASVSGTVSYTIDCDEKKTTKAQHSSWDCKIFNSRQGNLERTIFHLEENQMNPEGKTQK
jgi:hypothetical protein